MEAKRELRSSIISWAEMSIFDSKAWYLVFLPCRLSSLWWIHFPWDHHLRWCQFSWKFARLSLLDLHWASCQAPQTCRRCTASPTASHVFLKKKKKCTADLFHLVKCNAAGVVLIIKFERPPVSNLNLENVCPVASFIYGVFSWTILFSAWPKYEALTRVKRVKCNIPK